MNIVDWDVKDLMDLNYEILEDFEFEDLEMNPHVKGVENVGASGSVPGRTWYIFILDDNTELNIYN